MMIAALGSVLVWTVLGHGEYAFSPQCLVWGAALCSAFCILLEREDSNSTYSAVIPTRKYSSYRGCCTTAAIGAEGSYQAFSPFLKYVRWKVTLTKAVPIHSMRLQKVQSSLRTVSLYHMRTREDSVDPLDGLNIVSDNSTTVSSR